MTIKLNSLEFCLRKLQLNVFQFVFLSLDFPQKLANLVELNQTLSTCFDVIIGFCEIFFWAEVLPWAKLGPRL